jgi:uncharacterized protein YdaU (DUF1376 family)
MSRRPWFPFYAGDYLADTGHLTLAQHGAYLLLILHYYRTTTLPANAVHRICRCSNDADKEICDSILREFFVLDGEVYRHKRIEEEIVILDHKSEACAARAKIAANARWKPSSAPAASVAAPPAEEPPAEENPKPRKKKQVSLIDPRHSPVREFILSLHEKTFPATPTCPWDGRTGTVLKKLLKANPSWTVSQIQGMVKNRFDSEGIAPDSSVEWLPRLSSYAAGPLNKFRHLDTSKSNGKAPIGNALDYQRGLLGVSK